MSMKTLPSNKIQTNEKKKKLFTDFTDRSVITDQVITLTLTAPNYMVENFKLLDIHEIKNDERQILETKKIYVFIIGGQFRNPWDNPDSIPS